MTCRVDTSSLFAGACVVSLYAGHGVRGDAVPSTGTHGPSPLYNDLSLPADAAKEFRWAITTAPSAGSILVYEDGSYAYTAPSGATDLTVTYGYRLWEDGVDKGTATETIVIGAGSGGPPDTAPPVLVGSINVSALAPTSYTLTWPAGTDDVAVSSYERSLDGGTSWTDVGNVLTVNISGRTPSSTDQVRVRALDAAGNTSTPPLSTAVTLPAAPDTTPPVLVGAITVTAVSTSSIAVVWPAASDNVGVAGYEVSDDGGSAWVGVGNVLAHTYSGLAPSTSYALRVRAVDVAGNVSAALALTQSTAAPAGAWNGGSVRPFVRGGAVGPQGDDYPGSDILRPAEDVLPMDVAERDYIAFDWEDWLAEGEAIIDVVITLEAVGDVDAAERRLGGVERYGNRARQWVEGVQRDAWYLMRATGTTSHGGRRITLGARFKGVRES